MTESNTLMLEETLQQLQRRVAELERDLAEARKDRERLDWLGYCCHGFVRGTGVSKWTIEAPVEGIRVVRQAIDAARSKGGAA